MIQSIIYSVVHLRTFSVWHEWTSVDAACLPCGTDWFLHVLPAKKVIHIELHSQILKVMLWV